MVCFNKIDLREGGGAVQGRSEVVNVRDRIPVGDGDAIESTVVAARPPITRTFRHHVQGRCPTAGRWADDAELQHMFKLGPGDLEFLGRKATRPGEDWWASIVSTW